MKKVLIIAAHPDDEILGCGATIAKHTNRGDQVKILITAEGLTSRDSKLHKTAKQALFKLKKTAQKANQELGAKDVVFFDFPDNRMDSFDLLEIIKPIEEVINHFKPNIIYTHHDSDLNIDHKILSQAVITACRPTPNSSVREIYFFEVLSASHWGNGPSFTPNYFNCVSDFIEHKISALETYKSEMRNFPHARSIQAIRALATLRGALAGLNSAEAFEIFRIIKE